ncbi:unnamed protein product [Chironomus riparius]|uniref:Ionotropic receptor n=1 Tax=Chironomus riparius TaxID=315576 RepID=A0A9N9S6N9_9DIPT|nr:unnamed protein product [Chironomus riparius]
MKATILFLLFSSLFLLNSSRTLNVLQQLSSEDNKIINSVCKIVNDITESKNDTRDILVGYIGGNQWSQAVNDVAKCIADKKAVVMTDFLTIATESTLKKASVIVLVSYQADRNLIRQLISSQLFSSVWHHMAKIICIVPKSTSIFHRTAILNTFASLGFYNVVTVHENDKDEIVVDVLNPPTGKMSLIINPDDSAQLFPDKLKDMAGYPYKIPVIIQPPLVQIRGKQIRSPMIHFLKDVSEKQNAGIQFTIQPDGAHLGKSWETRQMHLTINTAASFDNPEPKLINYEKRGFCALIPIPQKTLTFRIMIIMPFDYLIWAPLVLSIAGSFAVWWLYCGRGAVDSHWLLLAEIYKLFFGQGFTLSRNNHFMLLTLMQLICWLIFIISNAYQSEITSCMIEPFHENRLQTVADLLASNHEIVTDEGFAFIIKDVDEFEALRMMIKKTDLQLHERFEEEVTQKHSVMISMCDTFEHDLNRLLDNGRYINDDYYILPEPILWEFVRLEASYLNPFLERFQFYMDLSFQAGLPHMWKVLENLDQSRYAMIDASDVPDSLRFEDLHEVFRVLGIGLIASIFVFLFEIFYHDCLRYFDVRGFVKDLRIKMCSWVEKIRISKQRVRIIKVQSRNN